MKVHIRIERLPRYRFALRAFAYGAHAWRLLVDSDAAHLGDVERRRNRMAEKWAARVEEVEADGVPWPIELVRPRDAAEEAGFLGVSRIVGTEQI
jgi:hypothetical protein